VHHPAKSIPMDNTKYIRGRINCSTLLERAKAGKEGSREIRRAGSQCFDNFAGLWVGPHSIIKTILPSLPFEFETKKYHLGASSLGFHD